MEIILIKRETIIGRTRLFQKIAIFSLDTLFGPNFGPPQVTSAQGRHQIGHFFWSFLGPHKFQKRYKNAMF